MQSRQKVCSLSIDLGTVKKLKQAGQTVIRLPIGLQLPISRKVLTGQGQNGEVNFELVGNISSLITLGCDKMSVQAFEQNIFKNGIQIFIR
jgi:hypothetical protein